MSSTRRPLVLASATALALIAGGAAGLVAQETSPRVGAWRLVSDAPSPALHIMTYEPYGDGGVRITFESTSRDGQRSEWSYLTMHDGVFRPVAGHEGDEAAVEVVDGKTERIILKRDGRVRQITISVISEDGSTIQNEYHRIEDDGTERVLRAVYERIR